MKRRIRVSTQTSNTSLKESWQSLQSEISTCYKCRLHTQGISPICGDGSIKVKVVFIGEAPGFMENKLKKPFVGRSGEILNNYLSKINLSRKDVFITNVIKCRPPKNRDPMSDEITACKPYLLKQIELLQADILVTLGRFAAQVYISDFINMNKIVGKIINLSENLNLLPMYHPATCLYNPQKYHPIFDRNFQTLKEYISRFKIIEREMEDLEQIKSESYGLDRFLK
jgi:DNA polymerase